MWPCRLAATEADKLSVRNTSKQRGRSKIGKRIKRKHRNIIDQERMRRTEFNKAKKAAAVEGAAVEGGEAPLVAKALSRFAK